MTAFVPQTWEFPVNADLIISGPSGIIQQQTELARRLTDVTGQLSNGIYGESSKFTPVAQGASTAGTGTYDVQVGYYVRFGNLLWFTINLQWDDANHTGTGDLQITGFPVSSLELTNLEQLVLVYNSQSGAEFTGVGKFTSQDNKISSILNGGTTVQINGADYQLQITGVYRVV